MRKNVVDADLPGGTVEARLIILDAVERWSPDHGNMTARAAARCPWHGSPREDKVLVLAAVLAEGIYPTRWFCTSCHKGGLARLEGGRVRLEWNGLATRRLGFKA